MSRTKEDIALDAIYEGMLLLGMLTGKTEDPLWMINSVPRSHLDGLARELGYRNANHVYDSVDADRAQRSEQWRDVYDCETW